MEMYKFQYYYSKRRTKYQEIPEIKENISDF